MRSYFCSFSLHFQTCNHSFVLCRMSFQRKSWHCRKKLERVCWTTNVNFRSNRPSKITFIFGPTNIVLVNLDTLIGKQFLYFFRISSSQFYLLQFLFDQTHRRDFTWTFLLRRVHTGFEWNKYNQTHYDMDNPPPKIVQGYKFNIFYPDLIDKHSTPEYHLVNNKPIA